MRCYAFFGDGWLNNTKIEAQPSCFKVEKLVLLFVFQKLPVNDTKINFCQISHFCSVLSLVFVSVSLTVYSGWMDFLKSICIWVYLRDSRSFSGNWPKPTSLLTYCDFALWIDSGYMYFLSLSMMIIILFYFFFF